MSSAIANNAVRRNQPSREKKIKLLVWDLDETLWHGTLAENETVRLRESVPEILRTLDSRGILQSIASKNEHEIAMDRLRHFGLDELFIHPAINWSSKSTNIVEIARQLNIGLDTVAFIDDQDFEREEMRFTNPEILILDVEEPDTLTSRNEFMPRFITDESAQRRKMYMAETQRKGAEAQFIGPKEEFLATLQMALTIAPATEADLRRAEELTLRTNQLNSTGRTYSYDDLVKARESERYLLLMASLEDKWGPYGKIGMALIEKAPEQWSIKLILMSCRVISRGVGTIFINHIIGLVRTAGVRLFAEFISTGQNRMMLMTYRMAGFREVGQHDGVTVLQHVGEHVAGVPEYIQMRING